MNKKMRDKLNTLSAQAFEYQRAAKYIMQKTDDNMDPIGGKTIVIGAFTVNPTSRWQSIMRKGYIKQRTQEIDGKTYVTGQYRHYPSLEEVETEMQKVVDAAQNKNESKSKKEDQNVE